MSRVYCAENLKVNETVVLNEATSHYLSRVLRLAVNEVITVFNGQGGEYLAAITRIDKKHVTLAIQTFTDREAESPIQITLAQGMARGEKMDFIIQKACELGVTNIQPLITARCNVKLEGEREEKRIQHWRAIIQSACEQCGRNRLPTVLAPVALNTWLSSVEAEHKMVLAPTGQPYVLNTAVKKSSYALLIGPEGGLSDAEIASAVTNGFEAVQLGPRILRTETATVAGLTFLQVLAGDFA